jgi:hypothetical protein
LKITAPIIKYNNVRTKIETISGMMLLISIFMIRVLLRADIACDGVINPWRVTGYPAIENNVSLLIGNAAPVKNINKNIGKLPATRTSPALLVTAAIIRLNAIIDILVKPAIISIITKEPSY